MSTTLVPASIIGKIFIVNKVRRATVVSTSVVPEKVATVDGYRYWECRIKHYRPETGEILLRLDSCTNSEKWYGLWYQANEDWVKELNVKYIFIE